MTYWESVKQLATPVDWWFFGFAVGMFFTTAVRWAMDKLDDTGRELKRQIWVLEAKLKKRQRRDR